MLLGLRMLQTGEYPTIADWANHLTTIFPEVRHGTQVAAHRPGPGKATRLCDGLKGISGRRPLRWYSR